MMLRSIPPASPAACPPTGGPHTHGQPNRRSSCPPTLSRVVGRAQQRDDGAVCQRSQLVQVAARAREEHNGVVRCPEGAVGNQARWLGLIVVAALHCVHPVVRHVVQLAVQHAARQARGW